jgi:polysaccharide export outer membrane protein
MSKVCDRWILRLLLSATILHPSIVNAQLAPTPLPPEVIPLLRSINPEPQPTESAYQLGAGDLVRLEMFDVAELTFEPKYTVLFDGTLNLPWIGGVSVQGLTLKQASDLLKARYRKYVKNPIVNVSLIAPRPLRIGILGGVNRPGSYIVNPIGIEVNQTSLNQQATSESGNQWPTVTKAIQTAGGVAQLANVRAIEVRRPRPDGSQDTIQVDLWKYLKQGDLAQDTRLQDGDTIFVPIATAVNPAEAMLIAASNFSPAQVQVNVVGEVVRPGTVTVRPNATLMQTIVAAGGISPGRGNTTKVELVRLMPDGTVSRREYKFDLSKGLDEASNPPIHQDDVVVVNRSNTAKLSDLLGTLVSPLTSGFGLMRLLFGR